MGAHSGTVVSSRAWRSTSLASSPGASFSSSGAPQCPLPAIARAPCGSRPPALRGALAAQQAREGRSRRPVRQNFAWAPRYSRVTHRIAMTHHRHLHFTRRPRRRIMLRRRAAPACAGELACARVVPPLRARHLARAAHGGPLSSSSRHRGPACRCAAGGRRWPPCTCSPAQEQRSARISTASASHARTAAAPARGARHRARTGGTW